MRRQRGRRGRRAAAWVAGALLAIPLAAVLLLHYAPAATRIANEVLPRLAPWPGAEVTVGHVDLDGFWTLTLGDVRVRGPRERGRASAGTARPMVSVDHVRARFRLLPLLLRRMVVHSLEVSRADVVMSQGADSTWDLLAPFDGEAEPGPRRKAEPGPREAGGSVRLDFGRVTLTDARVRARFASHHDSVLIVRDLNVRARAVSVGRTPSAIVDTAYAVLRPPGRSEAPVRVSAALRMNRGLVDVEGFRLTSDASDVRASGTLALPRADSSVVTDVDFRLVAEPLDLGEVRALVPGLDAAGSLWLEARARGSGHLIDIDAHGRGSDGSRLWVQGSLTPRADGPLRYAIEAGVDDLDAAVWGGPEGVREVDATVEVDLAGQAVDSLTGTVSARASVAELSRGALEHARLDGTLDRGAARVDLNATASPWGRIEATGTVRPIGERPRYDARVELVQHEALRLGPTSVEAGELVAYVEGTGFAPGDGTGSASVELAGAIGGVAIREALLTGRWGEERARADLVLSLEGSLEAGSLEAGSLEATLEADWSAAAVRLEVPHLRARRLDVAALVGDSASGAVSVEGRGALVWGDPGSPEAEVEGVLERLTWRGDVVVDSGLVSVELREGALRAEVGLDAPAGAVRLSASGEPFDPARAWELERLEVESLNLAGLRPGLPESSIAAVLRLEGRFPPGAEGATRSDGAGGLEAAGTLSVRPSSIGPERVDTLDLRLSFAEGLLELEGEASALDGRVTLAARATPLADVPTFRVDRLRLEDVRIDSTLAGPVRAELTGTLSVEGALPPDALPRVEGAFDLEPTPINFDQVARGRATLSLRDARARLDVAAEVERGSAELHGSVDLARDGGHALTFDRVELEGLVELPDDERTLVGDTMESALEARFRLSGSGTASRALDWTGSITAAGRLGGARLDSLEVSARTADGVLHLDTLVLASNVARASGGGSVALTDSAQLPQEGIRALLEVDSLHAAGALSSVRPLSMRGATAELLATNGGGAVRVETLLGAGGTLAADFTADTLSVAGAVAVQDGAVRSASLRLGGQDLGWGAAFLESLSGDVSYEPAVGAEFAVSAARDSVHRFVASGIARPTDRAVSLDELRLSFAEEDWALARPALLTWGDTLDAGGLTLVAGPRRIALDGHLDRAGEQDLTVTLDAVSLDPVAELAGLERLSGTLGGRVRVTGPPADVALDGTLSGTIGGTTFDVSVGPAGSELAVEARLGDAGGQSLEVRGSVPFPVTLAGDRGAGDGGDPSAAGAPAGEADADGRASLEITADAFSLGWLTPLLQPAGVEEWEAWLTADARVEGTLEAPRASGSVGVAGGRLRVRGQGIAYQDLQADLELAGDRIEVRSLHARAGGSADAEGTIRLTSLARPELDLRARLDGFRALHNEWTRLGLSGELTLGGDVRAPVVGGSVRLLDTDVFADPVGTAAGGGDPVELTPEDYEMLEYYFGLTPDRSEGAEDDPLGPWAMDLTVELGTDVWLRRRARPELRLQLDGSLDVRKEAGDSIQLFGTVELLPARSYFEELGRRFEVTSGTVTFNGSMWGWQADVQAAHEVPSIRDPSSPEVTITLHVTGGLEDLELLLGSQPAMETADVLSYLATGRPAASAVEFGQAGDEGGGPGGVVGAGAALALDQAAAALERTAAESVGLDVMEIRHQGLDGATLIAGRYVSPRLFVGLRQPLTLGVRPDDALTETTRGTEMEVEYTAYRWLLLSLEGGQSTLRFFFRTRHAF